jgi:hypothetical protein
VNPTLDALDAALGLDDREKRRILRKIDELDRKQVEQLLVALRAEAFLRCAKDGLLWLKFVKTRDEADQTATIKPFPVDDPYVRGLWTVLECRQRIVIAKSRQMLMSWVAAAYCVWHARFHPNSYVVWQTQKEDDADKMVCLGERAGYLGRMQFIERHLPSWMAVPFRELQGIISYDNGSMIEGVPGGQNQARSKVASVIVEDEFAYQEEASGVYASVNPLIQKTTKFAAISTPNGFDNVFAKLYHGQSIDGAEDGSSAATPRIVRDRVTELPPIKGLQIHQNALGFTVVRLHYTADPKKDPENPDPVQAAAARRWLDQQKQSYPDPNDFQREFEINFFAGKGTRVFPQFTEAIHTARLHYNPRKVLYRGWDFGWHCPVCLITQVDAKEHLLVIQEIVGKQRTTRDFAGDVIAECAKRYPNHAAGFVDYCDPAGQQIKSIENDRNERRDVEVLNGLGVFPTYQYGWSNKDGRTLVHQLLAIRSDGTPGLSIDPSGAPYLLQAFLGQYIYPERRDGKVSEDPNDDTHPWGDVMAALRYLVTGLFEKLGLRRLLPVIPPPVIGGPALEYHGYGTVRKSHARLV